MVRGCFQGAKRLPTYSVVYFYQRCLVRNPRERISIAELLEHPYLQLKPQASPEPGTHAKQTKRRCVSEEAVFVAHLWPVFHWLLLEPTNSDLKRILTDLAALQSPNSIIRAANVRLIWKTVLSNVDSPEMLTVDFCFLQNLAKMCSSGRKLDVAECAKSSS